MRVEEYLGYRAKLKGVDRKTRQQHIDYCLVRCRIKEVRRRLIGTLSKGYRQRVGLADAMIHDPLILILDEPTVGLDPLQIRETLALIKEMGEKRTILLSTHILSEMEAVCNRVIIITSGRLHLDKKLSDLMSDPVVVVEANGPADQIGNVLRTTDGVRQVNVQDAGKGQVTFEVHSRGHHDLREAIGQRLLKNGWPVRRLDLRRRRLEDHFFDVMGEADPLKRLRAGGTEPAAAPTPNCKLMGARKKNVDERRHRIPRRGGAKRPLANSAGAGAVTPPRRRRGLAAPSLRSACFSWPSAYPPCSAGWPGGIGR